MKTNKFKYLLGAITTLCMVFILMPTTALANGPEVYDGDIYVSNGQYAIINGSGEESEVYELNKDNPIRGTGEAINRNIYVMDDITDLYFNKLDLGTGGIYVNTDLEEYPEIKIKSGSVRAKEIDANYIEIGSDASVYVKENVTGTRFHSYGGTMNVDGNILVSYIWLKEASTVKVGGNVECKYLINQGGSVRIDGDLIASNNEPKDGDSIKCYIDIEEGDENKNPAELYVGGEISAVELITIKDSTVYANSINCDNGFIGIDDSATLFNAVNGSPNTIPLNASEPPLNLHRTTLSGLIPNREANIVISYDDHDGYTKEFTAKANEEGQVFVWLVGNKNLSGTAIYDGDEPITLTAEASASSGVVENLEFPYEPDNDTPTSESNESSSTEGDSNVSTSDTETKKDDSDNAPKTTDSVKTVKADIPKTSDKSLMGLWIILSVTVSLTIAGTLIEKKNIKRQES